MSNNNESGYIKIQFSAGTLNNESVLCVNCEWAEKRSNKTVIHLLHYLFSLLFLGIQRLFLLPDHHHYIVVMGYSYELIAIVQFRVYYTTSG